MSAEIIYKTDAQGSKTKGVIMEHEENNIPEIVGLTYKQFFGFLFAAILLGAGSFGIGYALGFFKDGAKQKQEVKKDQNGNIIIDQAQPISDPHYVILGSFKNEKDAVTLQQKVRNLGKNATIKSKNDSALFILFLGPYNSQSLAQSEIEALSIQSISGSIIKELPWSKISQTNFY